MGEGGRASRMRRGEVSEQWYWSEQVFDKSAVLDDQKVKMRMAWPDLGSERRKKCSQY